MQICADDSPIRADRAVGVRDAGKGSRTIRALTAPHVDFISGDRLPKRGAGDAGQALVRRHGGFDIQKAQPADGTCLPVCTLRIVDRLSQHLIAAADAQNMAAAPDMGDQIHVPPLIAQEAEVTDGRFGPRNHHEIGVARDGTSRPQHGQAHAGLGRHRIEIVEICDARQGQADHMQSLPGRRTQIDGILGRKAMGVREPGQHAEPPPAGAGFDLMVTVIEQPGIAAELVDQKSLHHRGVRGIQHRLRTDDLGDHAAAVDIACQHDRDTRRARETHIRDVARAQVDFGRAARALDDDQIVTVLQPVKAVQHPLQQTWLQRGIVAGLGAGDGAALQDHLCAGIGFGLQQHRVHIGDGGQPAGAGLQGLRPADFATILGDGGVVRHVLRLERRHLDAATSRGAAQPGHQHRFADIRAGPLDHERGHWTLCLPSPSRVTR